MNGARLHEAFWLARLVSRYRVFAGECSLRIGRPLRAMNPLEGQLLHHSTGAFYVYHDGIKFELLLADIGDNLVDAIPSATPAQRGSLFTSTHSVSPEPAPEPFPGYSLRLPL